MGKVSKLFKGELKKIFLGPGIFFMTAFLVLVLTIAPKFFSPTSKTDLSTSVLISTSSVTDSYNSFLDYKKEYKENLDKINDNVNSLINNNANFKQNLEILSEELFQLKLKFITEILTGSIDSMLNCLDNMIEKAENLQLVYYDYIHNYVFPVVLLDDELDFNISFEIDQLLRILKKDGDITVLSYYMDIKDYLDNSSIITTIKNYISNIKNLTYSSENLELVLNDYFNSKDDYKEQIFKTMTESNANAKQDNIYDISDSNIKNMQDLSLKYIATDDNIYKIIENSLYLEISKDYSDSEISKFVGFKDFNSYRFKENLTKHKFLLENDMADSEIASMFSFNSTTSEKVNAFDYMYFTLEIASVLIIAFTVIMGAGMIAKEYSEGTIKLLVMRPFKRNKIIMAKILATMFLAFIFVMVSTIVTLITGYIIYGISFPSMLVIFNATSAFILPIWLVFLIYLASLMIKIWIFALLAIAISTIFKSYIAAVCISAGIYILNIILTFVSNGANWLKYNIFANLDIFKYFGGSFVTTVAENQNLTSLFASPVFADTTVWLSVIVIGVLALLLHIILFTIFRHRDIT